MDNEFLENATPEALAAYENDIMQQIAVSCLHIVTTPDNISSGDRTQESRARAQGTV